MATPIAGAEFPQFEAEGFRSEEALQARPHVFIVWRVGCPTCRLTIPFFQRLDEAYPEAGVVGIVQESRADLDAFNATTGLSLPQLADADLSVTRLLGVDLVPAYWLVDRDGTVCIDGASWDRKVVEAIGTRLAAMLNTEPRPIFSSNDDVPAFKPG